MKFKLFPPHIVREKEMRGKSGRAQAIVVTVDPTSHNPQAVYKHELVHVWQFYICALVGCLAVWVFAPQLWFVGFSLYGVLYQIPLVRFHFEAIAFGAQASISTHYVDQYARGLANNYKLKRVDYHKARKEIARWKEIFGEYS